MKNITIVILGVAIVIAIIFWPKGDTSVVLAPTTYSTYADQALGISFTYSNGYFLEERDIDTTRRLHRQIILMEDNEWNRKLARGEIKDTEGPPAITVDIFQNDLDRQSAREFITGSNNSNYKLGPGTISTSTKGDTVGLEYPWSGLYEGRSFVVANEDYVYMFSVSYLSPEDQIIDDFEALLKTVTIR